MENMRGAPTLPQRQQQLPFPNPTPSHGAVTMLENLTEQQNILPELRLILP